MNASSVPIVQLLVWWDTLPQQKQEEFIARIHPGWTFRMFRASTSSLRKAWELEHSK